MARTLRTGDRGPDVEAAKRGVYRYLGATAAFAELRTKPTAVRRTFQASFSTRVKDAQAKARQRQTGIVDAALWTALGKAGAIDAYSHLLIEKAAGPALVFPCPAGAPGVTVCQGLHQTAGLLGNWAIDFCAPPGTPVLAVEAGTIRKLSGHDPNEDTWDSLGVYGWSVHLETKVGYRYFLTHLGWRASLRVGQTVQAGTVLGKVGDQRFRPDHTHYGVTSPLGPTDAKRRIQAVAAAPAVPAGAT